MKRPPGRVIESEPPEGFRSSELSIPVNGSSSSSTDSVHHLGLPTKRNLLWLIGYLLVTTPQPGSAIPVPSATPTRLIIDHPLPPPPPPSVSFSSSLSFSNARSFADSKAKASSILGSPSPAFTDNNCDQVNMRSSVSPSPPPLSSSSSLSFSSSSSSSSLTGTQIIKKKQLIGRSIRVRTHAATLEDRRVVDRYLSDDHGNWHLNSQWELYGISPVNAAVSSSGSSGSTASVSSATGTSVSTTDSSTASPTTLPPGWGATSRSEFELPLIVACSVALALVVLVTIFTFVRRRNRRRKRPKKTRPRGKKIDPTEVVHSKPASITSSVASIRSQPNKERTKVKKSLVGVLRPKGTKGFLRLRKRRKSPCSDKDDEDGTEDTEDPVWASRTRPDGLSSEGVVGEGQQGPADRTETFNQETRPSRVASYSSLDPLSSLTSMSNSASLTDPPTTATTPTTTVMSSTRETSMPIEPTTNHTGEPTPIIHSPTSLTDSNRDLSLSEIPDSHQPTPPAYRASQATPSANHRQHSHHRIDDSSLSQSPNNSEHPPMPYSSSQAQHPDRLHHPAPPFTSDSLPSRPAPSDQPHGTHISIAGATSEGVIASTIGSVTHQPSTAIIDVSDYPRDEKFRPARPLTPPFPSGSSSHTSHQLTGRSTGSDGEMTTTTNMAHHLATDDKGVLARLASQVSAPVDLNEAPLTDGHESNQPEGTAPPGWELENDPSTEMTSAPAPFPSSSFSSSATPLVDDSDLSYAVLAGDGERTGILPAPPKRWGTKTMEDPYITLDAPDVILGPPDESTDLAGDDEDRQLDGVQGFPSAPLDLQSEPGGRSREMLEAEAPSAPLLDMEEGQEEEQSEEECGRREEPFEASAPGLEALEENASAPHTEL